MMNDNGDLREDLKVPDGDLGNQIRTDFENGRELLVSSIFILIWKWLLFYFIVE